MTYLIAGLVVFFAVHLIPMLPPLRDSLKARLGRGIYIVIFSAVSLIGILLMALGLARAEPVLLWNPVAGGRMLALMAMPVAFILVVAAYLPTHLGAKLRHPMLLGVSLWAAVHLLANGDLPSTLLFGAFLAYALIDMLLSRPRDSLVPRGEPKALYDGLAVVIGLAAFAGVLHAHGSLFGVPLMA